MVGKKKKVLAYCFYNGIMDNMIVPTYLESRTFIYDTEYDAPVKLAVAYLLLVKQSNF